MLSRKASRLHKQINSIKFPGWINHLHFKACRLLDSVCLLGFLIQSSSPFVCFDLAVRSFEKTLKRFRPAGRQHSPCKAVFLEHVQSLLPRSKRIKDKATCIVTGGNADHLRPSTMSACFTGWPGNDTVGRKYDIVPTVYGGGLNKFRQGKAALHNMQPVNAEVKRVFPSTDYRNSTSP